MFLLLVPSLALGCHGYHHSNHAWLIPLCYLQRVLSRVQIVEGHLSLSHNNEALAHVSCPHPYLGLRALEQRAAHAPKGDKSMGDIPVTIQS